MRQQSVDDRTRGNVAGRHNGKGQVPCPAMQCAVHCTRIEIAHTRVGPSDVATPVRALALSSALFSYNRIKRSMENQMKVPVFNGAPPMGLLPFLRTLVRACRHQNLEEAVAAQFLPLYIEGQAERIVSQRLGQYDEYLNPYARTFPHLVHALIELLLPDDVLDEAIKRVTGISQKVGETEHHFCDRHPRGRSSMRQCIPRRAGGA
jgi:hypothetical protein